MYNTDYKRLNSRADANIFGHTKKIIYRGLGPNQYTPLHHYVLLSGNAELCNKTVCKQFDKIKMTNCDNILALKTLLN